MALRSFGEFDDQRGYKTLDERVVRGSAGIMLALAMVAFINAFVVRDFTVLPYISGFMVANFLVGVFVNPKFSPTVVVSTWMVSKQTPLPIGAVQKRFAWSLGLLLSSAIFALSIPLQQDASWFNLVCELCLICIALLFLETAFGVCVGCKLYDLAVGLRLLKAPEIKPNCMGDACETETA